jgi:regulatory protein
MVARGYVDDAAFARDWVEARSRHYGPLRLRAELRAKGVAGTLIDAALAAASERQLEVARALARQRWSTLRRAEPRRAASRLADHLRRRGYSSALVARVVREMLEPSASGWDSD